jgi:hypothetical protein
MKPKSQTLFHFTKNLDILKEILIHGFWPQYCLEDQGWLMEKDEELYYGFPIVCFCDIPLTRINEHIEYYGKFGIGLSKKWVLSNGLNPVSYFANSSDFAKAIKTLLSNHQTKDAYYERSVDDMNTIFSYIKPLEGEVSDISGKKSTKEFYQECEWRYTAKRTESADKSSQDQVETKNMATQTGDAQNVFGLMEKILADIRIFDILATEYPEILREMFLRRRLRF